jgi:hypothetical protein
MYLCVCMYREKKSHFHLTAIDHMLGNVQPALFDVATMLRGHLRICAVARSAMSAQAKDSAAISTQLEIKEASFERIKALITLLESTRTRQLELRHMAKEILEKLGPDLQRFLERKRRARKSTTVTPATLHRTPAGTSIVRGALSPLTSASTTQSVLAALSAAASSSPSPSLSIGVAALLPPAPPSMQSSGVPMRWFDAECLASELEMHGLLMDHEEGGVLPLPGLISDEGEIGLREGLLRIDEVAAAAAAAATIPLASGVAAPASPPISDPIVSDEQGRSKLPVPAVAGLVALNPFRSPPRSHISTVGHGNMVFPSTMLTLPSPSPSPPSASATSHASLSLERSASSSSLSASHGSAPHSIHTSPLDSDAESEGPPSLSTSPIDLRLPASASFPSSSNSMRTLRPPPAHSSSWLGLGGMASSGSLKSRSLPPSPPSPLSWPALSSAPTPTSTRLLSATSTAGSALPISEDIWPSQSEAEHHRELARHALQHQHGQSSHSKAEEHSAFQTSPRSTDTAAASVSQSLNIPAAVGSRHVRRRSASVIGSSGIVAGNAKQPSSPPPSAASSPPMAHSLLFSLHVSPPTSPTLVTPPSTSITPTHNATAAVAAALHSAAHAVAAISPTTGSASPTSPVSPPSASSGATSAAATRGYMGIKKRYFAHLGQAAPSVSPPRVSPSSSFTAAALTAAAAVTASQQRNAAAAALALAVPVGPAAVATRASTVASSSVPTSPPLSSVVAVDPMSPPTPSPVSSPLSQPVLSVTSASLAIRPRAVFARGDVDAVTSPDGLSSSPNKRWMLRPLPANAPTTTPPATPVEGAISNPSSPAARGSSTSPLSPSLLSDGSRPSSPAPNASAGSTPEQPKKSWWRSLFSPRVKSEAELEKERQKAEKKAAENEAIVSRKNSVAGGRPPMHTRGGSIASAMSSPSLSSIPSSPLGTNAFVSDPELPPLSADEPRLLSSDWSAWATLLDALETANERQQRAWEVLESVLDKRERAQAEERRLLREEEARKVAAATAAAEAVAARAEVEKQEEAARIAAMCAGAKPILLGIAPPSTGEQSVLSSSPKHVHSSHSNVSCASALLVSSATTSPSSTVAAAAVLSDVTSPLDESGTSGGGVAGSAAARVQRKQSILTLLQGVPAPTLMPTSGQLLESVGGTLLLVTPTSATQQMHHTQQSRSLPITPPRGTRSSSAVYSFPPGTSISSVAPIPSDVSGSSVSVTGPPARRASDSAAPTSSGGVALMRPRSSPPTAFRSSSFTDLRAAAASINYYATLPAGRFNHGSFQTGTYEQQGELDAELLALLAAERNRHQYRQQHHSPPSPSSLVF